MKFLKKHKRAFTVLMILGMFMQILAPAGGVFASAEENDLVKDQEEMSDVDNDAEAAILDEEDSSESYEENSIVPLSGPKDLGNIFTFKSFKVNGTEADKNQVVDIRDGTTVNLSYTWDTIGKNAQPGDWAEIEIPDAFKLEKTFDSNDIIVGETNVGTYSLKDNKIRFEFNENIASNDVKNGSLGFGVKFNEESFTEDVVTEIEFNDTGNKTIAIIGKPDVEINSINKEGLPDSDKDAKTITWTVDLTNPSETEITDAKLKDILPEGLELDSSSLKVNGLNIKLNGKLSLGDEVTGLIPKIDGQNFELTLPNIAPYKGYRIEYTTNITDKSKKDFTNSASFEHGDKKLPAEATVTVERSADIEKDGEYKGYNKDKEYDTIEWWIDVNKSGGSIDNAIIEDTLPEELELVDGSIEIFKLTQSGNDFIEFPLDKTADKFPVTLGQIDEAYRIKFKTSIDYSKVNDGKYQEDNSFTNKTILKNGDEEIGEAEKTVEFNRDPILSKTGDQIVNYEKKEIKWTVTVNKANHPIKGADVTDKLPKGLTISKDDIVVKNSAGKVVTDKVKITVPDNDGSTPTEVTINLGDINEEYTIEYTTKITDFNEDKFFNGASIAGEGVGSGGTIEPVPVEPAKNHYTKSYKGIDYNEKTMSWIIEVDPKREPIYELTITDTFPNNGLTLLETGSEDGLAGNLEISLGDKTLVLGNNYELNKINDNFKNGFVIKFINYTKEKPINDKLTITFTTSFDPDQDVIENEGNGENKYKYINNAKFNGKTVNDNGIEEESSDDFKVKAESWNSGKKSGKLISVENETLIDGWKSGNERKIQWEVYINYLQQNLGNHVNVKDELGYNGEIDKDSFEVKTYTVAKNGKTTLGDSLAETDYTVTVSEDKKSFTLDFTRDVTERYAIVFTTSVPNISLGQYKNTATTTTTRDKKEFPIEGSVKFKEHEKNISKTAEGETSGKVYTNDEITWNIKINESLSYIEKDVIVKDIISTGQVYVKDSLKIYKHEESKDNQLGTDKYTLDVDDVDENSPTILKINFNESIYSTYEIVYKTVITEENGEINNKVEYSGNNLQIVENEKVTFKAEQFSYADGEWDPKKGKITVNKVDEDGIQITGEDPEDNAVFKLYYDLNGEYKEFGEYETEDGVLTVGNLSLDRTYYLSEIKSPDGYTLTDELIEIYLPKSTNHENIVKNINVTNYKKISVTGEKIWKDGPDKKPTIELQLYRDGEKYLDTVSLANGKNVHTWTGLDKVDSRGNEYTYTIDEVKTPSYYRKSISEDGLTVTNTYVGYSTSVTGKKVWVNGPEVKPNIELQLCKRQIITGYYLSY